MRAVGRLASNPSIAEFQTAQKDVIARIGATPLSELPSLAAWRGVFRSFGVDPTQYRNAAEALLRRLPTGKPMPYDESYFRHTLPGGVLSTTRRQLTEQRRIARWVRINDASFSRDTARNTLSGHANPDMSFFAVSAPEPSSLVVVMLAGGVLMLRRARGRGERIEDRR